MNSLHRMAKYLMGSARGFRLGCLYTVCNVLVHVYIFIYKYNVSICFFFKSIINITMKKRIESFSGVQWPKFVDWC